MSNTNNIIGLLEAGIKAESLRQRTIANNVANLETPGYRSLNVKFEKLLAKALQSQQGLDGDEVEAEVYRANETPLKPNGNDVSLEAEVGKMIKNSLRHKAYIRLLGKKYRQIETAIDIR
jgi:flagellar basal-body rod protein FlgB